MSIIATGTLDGHEARGQITIVSEGDKTQVRLRNLWVAPGAPDVRLYVSTRSDGTVDDTATDLGKLPDHQSEIDRDLPDGLDPRTIGSVIIHCTVYSVLFGYGTVGAQPSETDAAEQGSDG